MCGCLLFYFLTQNLIQRCAAPLLVTASAMSSGGFGTTHNQNTTNDNRKHRLTK